MPGRTESERESGRRLARVIACVFGGVLLMLVLFGLWQHRGLSNLARNWGDLSDGSALAREMRGPQNVLDYIVGHAAEVSLVAYRVGDEAHGIYLNADRPRALAGTVTLAILCEYERALSAGALHADEPVTIADWEKYWLPTTDGGAHDQALARLRSQKFAPSDKVPLQDLVHSMLRSGDGAAADYLMQRLGREQLSTLPERLGLPNEQAPLPFAGVFLSWENTREQSPAEQLLERYHAPSNPGYVAEVWRLADALRDDPQLRAAERARLAQQGMTLTLGEQAKLARALTPHGSARDYAQLMARIQRGALPGSTDMQAELQWPLQNAETRARFDQLGTKSGSLPSIATSATYATPKGSHAPSVVALFFEGMPIAVWLEFMHTFVQQSFEQQLLSDGEFFERVRQRLAAVTVQ